MEKSLDLVVIRNRALADRASRGGRQDTGPREDAGDAGQGRRSWQGLAVLSDETFDVSLLFPGNTNDLCMCGGDGLDSAPLLGVPSHPRRGTAGEQSCAECKP